MTHKLLFLSISLRFSDFSILQFPDFQKIKTHFQNSLTSELHIIKISMTSQIKAKTMQFMQNLSSLPQRILFFFNLPLESANKLDNRGIWEKRENRGYFGKFCIFCKKNKIYNKIHILNGIWNDTCLFRLFHNIFILLAYSLRKS